MALRRLLCCLLAVSIAGPAAAEAKKDAATPHLPPGLAKKLDDLPVPPAVGNGGVPAPDLAPVVPSKPVKLPKVKPPKAQGPSKPAPAPAASPPSQPPSSAQAAPITATPSAPAAGGDTAVAAPPSVPPSGGPDSQADRRKSRGRVATPERERRSGTSSRPGAAQAGGTVAGPARGTADSRSAARRPARTGADTAASEGDSVVTRTVRDIVETVPGWMKLALAVLAALALALGAGYVVTALRARSLDRQRGELLSEVGLLQSALLPAVPEVLGALRTSVAYRPADGPGAGGDFYDALELDGGRTGFVLGDVSGHGRDALERTAFMRYTLRAYLEAGLEPRVALQVAERAIGERLGTDFATVLLAVHDPMTASLRYASAGHPAPIVVGGSEPFQAVVAGASPPIGVGQCTGLRQTCIPLMPGTVVCLYTDGLIEARTPDGLLGAERLERILADLGPDATASVLLDRVSQEATAVPDDMATCLLTPTAGVTAGGFRTELLDVSADEAGGDLPRRFLTECGVPAEDLDASEREIRETAELYGGAILSVAFGTRLAVRVFPRNVASIEAASWRAASAAR